MGLSPQKPGGPVFLHSAGTRRREASLFPLMQRGLDDPGDERRRFLHPKAMQDKEMSASILQFLRANGEQLDADIAAALHIPMAQLKNEIEQLSAAGEVICCNVTRFIDSKKIEGVSCRLSCDLPAPARGRKPGAKKESGNELDLL